jgi:hypothetical protein
MREFFRDWQLKGIEAAIKNMYTLFPSKQSMLDQWTNLLPSDKDIKNPVDLQLLYKFKILYPQFLIKTLVLKFHNTKLFMTKT